MERSSQKSRLRFNRLIRKDTLSCLGIDIGGANIKYATSSGETHAVEFPLWQRPNDLCRQLQQDLGRFHAPLRVGITMTGELADCFLDRAIGVRHIAEQAVKACEKVEVVAPRFYAVDGGLYDLPEAIERVDTIAASNWHALASFVGKEYCDDGLLIDIGSTTSDLIPIRNGVPSSPSQTDFDRLVEGSLVYLGGDRTSVCSLVGQVSFQGQPVPVMREVFATMQDVRVLLGFEREDKTDCSTADGKPKDAFHAANRMARSIGLDHRRVSIGDAVDIASQVHVAAQNEIEKAMLAVGPNHRVVTSGHANDLIPSSACADDVVDLQTELGPSLSRSATAFAIAKIVQNA